MSTPDPEGFSMLAKVIGAGAAIFGPVGGLWIWIDSRFAKKHTVNNQLQEHKAEFALHRQTTREDIRKLYENAEHDRKLVRDGFDQLSKEIHETHITLLNRMDRE